MFGLSPILLLLIAAILIVLGGIIVRRLPSSTFTWRTYLRGQGTLLPVFLFLGAAIASIAFYFGPSQGKTSIGGKVIEFRKLNPSDHIVYEEQNVEQFHRITLFARTTAPQNGSATVVIYQDSKASGAQEINRIEAVSDSWSRWDHKTSGKTLTLKIMNGAGAGATDVDVLMYLFPE